MTFRLSPISGGISDVERRYITLCNSIKLSGSMQWEGEKTSSPQTVEDFSKFIFHRHIHYVLGLHSSTGYSALAHIDQPDSSQLNKDILLQQWDTVEDSSDRSIKHPHTSMNIFTRNTNLSQRKCEKVMHIFGPFRHSWDILLLCGFLWELSSLLLQSKDFQFKWTGDYKWPILQVL